MRTLAETNERLEEVNKELLRRVAELEAQLAAAVLSADNERNIWVDVVSARATKEQETWNAAIEAAIDVCERMRERFVILEQDERSSYEERHDNGTSAVSLMQATNAIKSLLK